MPKKKETQTFHGELKFILFRTEISMTLLLMPKVIEIFKNTLINPLKGVQN